MADTQMENSEESSFLEEASPIIKAEVLTPPPKSTRRSRMAKERREPSVTPRKFKKFFAGHQERHPLSDITAQALNAQSGSGQPFRDANTQIVRVHAPADISTSSFPSRESKRRKVTSTPDPTSSKDEGIFGGYGGAVSSPCERAAKDLDYMDEDSDDERSYAYSPPAPRKRSSHVPGRGLSSQLLSRDFGGASSRSYNSYPVDDWQQRTADFCSRPEDVHSIVSMTGSGRRAIPFCARALNRSDETLVAIGDEEGRVRILETAKGGVPSFGTAITHYNVHANAIIDMDYCNDDTLLATASGDQSARVYDVRAEAVVSILGTHYATLKQVKFQPGANNKSILATSSRDGDIQIWDLRCNGLAEPASQIYVPKAEENMSAAAMQNICYERVINDIHGAHKPLLESAQAVRGAGTSSGRTGEVSVTSIQFLQHGREHLLISASESETSIKLWDIRQIHNRNRRCAPLASTAPPKSHSKWRQFGINSLTLNTDCSRFYALCRDNTIYAYSTAHLMLGVAPELAPNSAIRPAATNTNQEGMGPLYGFRHAKLHANSFYVKAALRKAKNGNCEMLAVGSSDGCAILFPTDERYLPKNNDHLLPDPDIPPFKLTAGQQAQLEATRPALARTAGIRTDSDLIISTNGTALIRGHDHEVGSLTWTTAGELVTISDDYLVRVWREDEIEARKLRQGGEAEGARWACGWAAVERDTDDNITMEMMCDSDEEELYKERIRNRKR